MGNKQDGNVQCRAMAAIRRVINDHQISDDLKPTKRYRGS